MEPGVHWPGYDADEDAEWVFVPDDVHSGDYDLQDYVNAVEDISAIHIQAAVRQSLAQRRTAALHAAAAAKSSSVASRKSFSVATTTYGLRLLVFAFAILIAKRLAPNPLASEGPPKLLYASLTRAIEDGEREFEAAARSSTTTTSPVSATTPTVVDGLTWNELQRRTGGYGFTKEQISLMWSAHKKGPLTRDGFRAHCEGRSLSRKTESAMWLQHKLFTATGVRVVPRRRA